MILYHVTRRDDAVMIQAGFQDVPTPHGMGVWLAEHPPEIQDGSSGDPSWRSCSTCPARRSANMSGTTH